MMGAELGLITMGHTMRRDWITQENLRIIRTDAESRQAWHNQAVGDLLSIVGQADAATVELASRWYDETMFFAAYVGRKRGGRRLGSAVIAIISPQCSWAENRAMALKFAVGGWSNVSGQSFTQEKRAKLHKAELLARVGRDPHEAVSGPKTCAFAANIDGDHSRVTVDIWALRAVLPGCSDAQYGKLSSGGNYRYGMVESAYVAANEASGLGLSNAGFQALVWILVRGSHN